MAYARSACGWVRVIVYENDCPTRSAVGRVRQPAVGNVSNAVVISFVVTSPAHGETCPGGLNFAGAPYALQLSEPIGDRFLVDGGIHETVLEWSSSGLPLFDSRQPSRVAIQRAPAIVGADACVTKVSFNNTAPTADRLEQMAANLGTFRGYVDGGRAYVGSFTDATAAFGGVEAFLDFNQTDVMLGHAQDLPIAQITDRVDGLVIAEVTGFWVRDGRQIWYPAFHSATLITPQPCTLTP